MVKLVFCCRRRPETTREEFQRYWLERHGPLVRSLRQALPQMRRYVQSHTLDTPVNAAIRAGRGTGPEYDGITEVWFDDADSLLSPATAEATAAARTLIEDEGRMLDLAACAVFVTVEHAIF